MNLYDLREAIRVRTGYPERGEVGTNRLNNVINQSLRTLWGEIPEVLLKDEYRLQLEPKNTAEFAQLLAMDPKTIRLRNWNGKNASSDVDTRRELGGHLLDKTLSGRWIEWQHNGQWYHRRIAELGLIYTKFKDSQPKPITDNKPKNTDEPAPGGNAEGSLATGAGMKGPMSPPVSPDMVVSSGLALGDGTPYTEPPEETDEYYWVLVVTEPIPENIIESTRGTRSTDLTIYTYEYPYDADIQSIRRIVKDPEGNPTEVPASLMGGEMSRAKISSGWRSEGQIQNYSRGDFFQLRAPHYTPTVSNSQGRTGSSDAAPWGNKWGFRYRPTTGHVEQPDWGPAGEFSYIVCHVWGRFSPNQRQIDGARGRYNGAGDILGPDSGYPFYISSASRPSKKISTTWGGSGIEITTPDIDYVLGYAQDSSLPSYQRSGVEKWVFRARHSTEFAPGASMGAGSINPHVENDGVYYLWQILDGSTTAITDIGNFDPVSRYRLKDFMGHYHIRFDKRPTSPDPVLISCIRRPPVLKYDSDAPRLPPECYGCIIELACSYLLGDRDGDMKRKASYYDNHLVELQKLKRMYSFSGHEHPSFSDGMSSKSYRRSATYPITEVS